MNEYTVECIIQWIICIAVLVLIAEFVNPILGVIAFVVLRVYTRLKRDKKYEEISKENKQE